MCWGCVIESVANEDGGHDWPEITDEMRAVARLVFELYRFEPVGGPCHVITDDFNTEDEMIEFCIDGLEKWIAGYGSEPGDDPARTRRVAGDLLDRLRPLSEAERDVAIAMGHGMIVENAYPPYVPKVTTEQRTVDLPAMSFRVGDEITIYVGLERQIERRLEDGEMISQTSQDVVVARWFETDLPIGPQLIEPEWLLSADGSAFMLLGFEIGTITGSFWQMSGGTLDLGIIRDPDPAVGQ